MSNLPPYGSHKRVFLAHICCKNNIHLENLCIGPPLYMSFHSLSSATLFFQLPLHSDLQLQ